MAIFDSKKRVNPLNNVFLPVFLFESGENKINIAGKFR